MGSLGGLPTYGLPPIHSSVSAAATKEVPTELGNQGLIGKMPSFQSVKVGSTAHTDPSSLLARAHNAEAPSATLPHEDPDPAAALLAKARRDAGLGGGSGINSMSGISLLPFKTPSLLRFNHTVTAGELGSLRGIGGALPSSAAVAPGVCVCVCARARSCVCVCVCVCITRVIAS
jgi:hypothetical protein